MIKSNGKECVTALKDIAAIELKGVNFRVAQRLSLLSQKNRVPVKALLVYGRNGFGKSTINAFKVIKDDEAPSIQSVALFNAQGTPGDISEEEQRHFEKLGHLSIT